MSLSGISPQEKKGRGRGQVDKGGILSVLGLRRNRRNFLRP